MNSRIVEELAQAAVILNKVMSDDMLISRISQAAKVIASSIKGGGKLIVCGNGGSMCDAMHFASELTGKYRENRKPFPAIAISDQAYLSCTSNDFGYDQSFSMSIMALANRKDVVVIISTSAKSLNCIRASEAAFHKGAIIITLTGNPSPDNELRALSDIDICVPHTGYADRIQEIHIKIIHILVMLIENELE